jgi:Outer membrane protein beta-barrel domain
MQLIVMNRLFPLLLLAVTAAFAQDAPIVNKGTTEIGGFVGASYGTQNFQVMGGGNVAYAVTRAIMPYAEFSYFPGLPITQDLTGTIGDPGTKASANYRLPLYDFHVGVHYRFPIKESPFVPYGVFGVGLLHTAQSTFEFDYTQYGNKITQTNTLDSANNFAVNFGAGVRYYTRQKVGFRAEAKFYHVGGIINGIFSKYEFGIFYQFH